MEIVQSVRPVRAVRAGIGVLVGIAAAATSSAFAQEPVPALESDLDLGDRLVLAEVEAQVIERNPDLEAARQALRAAEARPGIEGGLPNPELSGQLAWPSLGDEGERVGFGVGLTQRIPWSKLGPRASAARFEAEAAEARLGSTRDELARLARHAFVEYALAHESARINEELVGLVDQFRRAALGRYATGLVGESDPLQAETELARLEHAELVFVRRLRVAAGRLNALLHREWNAPLPDPEPLAAPDTAAALDPLVARAIEHRPELAEAEARVRAGRARLTLARRGHLPDLSLRVGYETFMDDRRFWPRVGLALDLPIYLGRIASEKRHAAAELSRERAREAAVRDRVTFEVQDAYLRMVETGHQVGQFADTWIPVSERALEAARAGYESGHADMLTLLDAERQLADARLRRQMALAHYHLARADLLRAVGAGEQSLVSPVEGVEP